MAQIFLQAQEAPNDYGDGACFFFNKKIPFWALEGALNDDVVVAMVLEFFTLSFFFLEQLHLLLPIKLLHFLLNLVD
jgi:hypothetical protein